MKFRDDHAADEAGKGVELVEPGAPETGDLGFGDRHAAEESEDDDDELVLEVSIRCSKRECETVWDEPG